MTKEEFAERIRQLVGEAAGSGRSLPEMIEVLEDQAEAMQRAHEG